MYISGFVRSTTVPDAGDEVIPSVTLNIGARFVKSVRGWTGKTIVRDLSSMIAGTFSLLAVRDTFDIGTVLRGATGEATHPAALNSRTRLPSNFVTDYNRRSIDTLRSFVTINRKHE